MSEKPRSAADLDPQALAEACAEAMWAEDLTAQRLDMKLESVAPGEAVVSMAITESMLNGHGLAHGGYIFILADTAFAFACNGYNQRTVGHQAAVTYIAPGRLGERLTATGREIQRAGRGGIYDITVSNDQGEPVAVFRGHSRTVKGTHLPE